MAAALAGKTVVKEIYVKGRLVNLRSSPLKAGIRQSVVLDQRARDRANKIKKVSKKVDERRENALYCLLLVTM